MRRRRRGGRIRRLLPALAILIPIAVIALVWWMPRPESSHPVTKVPQATAPSPRPTTNTATAARKPAASPVYPYSIVPGGVHSADDVAKAMTRDKVVAEHYRSVSVNDLRVEHLSEARLAYVSYRKGNSVYWTKRPIRLHPGEAILTDGATQIRARCGNCISLEPLLPTSEEEPDAVEFEALLPEDPAAGGPPVLPLPPAGFAADPPLSPVPEPGTLLLVGGGAVLSAVRYLRRRRKQSETDIEEHS